MDLTYPGIFFSYLFFALMAGLAVFFFVKSARDGYWGKQGEDIKQQVFQDDDNPRSER